VSLLGATGVGVGAIVGGGILVLAGVAFQATGPSAILAFAANGVVAVLTALSFAEMATAFPESGGAYTFAKKVLTVRAAFAVGWVLWFAYIVAGVWWCRSAAAAATTTFARGCSGASGGRASARRASSASWRRARRRRARIRSRASSSTLPKRKRAASPRPR
jgi:hypothetical protein